MHETLASQADVAAGDADITSHCEENDHYRTVDYNGMAESLRHHDTSNESVREEDMFDKTSDNVLTTSGLEMAEVEDRAREFSVDGMKVDDESNDPSSTPGGTGSGARDIAASDRHLARGNIPRLGRSGVHAGSHHCPREEEQEPSATGGRHVDHMSHTVVKAQTFQQSGEKKRKKSVWEQLEACVLCDARFNVISEDYRRGEGPRVYWPFICDNCKAEYSAKCDIRCRYCFSTVARFDKFVEHMRVVCHESWKCISQSALEHIYKCERCQRPFIHKVSLDKHVTICMGLKRLRRNKKQFSRQEAGLRTEARTFEDVTVKLERCDGNNERQAHVAQTGRKQINADGKDVGSEAETTLARLDIPHSVGELALENDVSSDGGSTKGDSSNKARENLSCLPDTQSDQPYPGKKTGGKRKKMKRAAVKDAEQLENCFICYKEFNVLKKTKGELYKTWPHICADCRVEHKSNSIHCHFCGHCPDTLYKYIYHLRTFCKTSWQSISDRTRKRIFQCDSCKRPFFYKSTFVKHRAFCRLPPEVKAAHLCKKSRLCHLCGKVYRNQSEKNLRDHMNEHKGVKPFQCPHCPKVFYRGVALAAHERKVHGARTYQCQYCSESFAVREHLEYHETKHTGELPFQCTECDQKFRSKTQITEHMMSHRGQLPHKCQFCGKGFVRKSNMRDHERGVHTGEMSYFCQFCNKGFLRKDYCLRHEGGCRQKPSCSNVMM